MGADYVKGDHLCIPGHSRTTVAVATTAYLSSGQQQGLNVQGNMIVPVHGICDGLFAYCSAAAGVGEDFTYTVMLNGAPTALAGVIGGAVDQVVIDLIGAFAVQEGDLVTVRLVTSAGAAVVVHSTQIRIKC